MCGNHFVLIGRPLSHRLIWVFQVPKLVSEPLSRTENTFALSQNYLTMSQLMLNTMGTARKEVGNNFIHIPQRDSHDRVKFNFSSIEIFIFFVRLNCVYY